MQSRQRARLILTRTRQIAALLGAIWLLLLLALTAMFASMSQLQFMLALINQSLHDPLTGCYNRGSGEQFLELQYNIATRQQSPLALSFVDIDDFKSVNDRYGHDSGDILLRWGGLPRSRLGTA